MSSSARDGVHLLIVVCLLRAALALWVAAGLFRYVDRGNTPLGSSEAMAFAGAGTFLMQDLRILGDTAYRSDKRCRAPFIAPEYDPARIDAATCRARKNYNHRHSNVRIKVEHAFSRVKHTWRLLQSQWRFPLARLPPTFLACCLLANWIHIERGLGL
jgi:hypothetical protein